MTRSIIVAGQRRPRTATPTRQDLILVVVVEGILVGGGGGGSHSMSVPGASGVRCSHRRGKAPALLERLRRRRLSDMNHFAASSRDVCGSATRASGRPAAVPPIVPVI
jgi:hypothetical protein